MAKEKNEIKVSGLTITWDEDEENKDLEVGSREITIIESNIDTSNIVTVLIRDVDKLCKALQEAKRINSWEIVKKRVKVRG